MADDDKNELVPVDEDDSPNLPDMYKDSDVMLANAELYNAIIEDTKEDDGQIISIKFRKAFAGLKEQSKRAVMALIANHSLPLEEQKTIQEISRACYRNEKQLGVFLYTKTDHYKLFQTAYILGTMCGDISKQEVQYNSRMVLREALKRNDKGKPHSPSTAGMMVRTMASVAGLNNKNQKPPNVQVNILNVPDNIRARLLGKVARQDVLEAESEVVDG